MKCAAAAFGDPDSAETSGDRFSIARGKENDMLHTRWRSARAKSRGFADPAAPLADGRVRGQLVIKGKSSAGTRVGLFRAGDADKTVGAVNPGRARGVASATVVIP